MISAVIPQEIPRHEPDEALVARVLAGDLDAFEAIIRRHNQRLYRVVRAILKDDSECEDVMQEAYVRAFQHLADFAGRAQLSTWLTRIAANEALGRLRSRRRDAPAAEVIPMSARGPEEMVASQETVALVEKAIDGLKDGFREVFVLRAVEEMSAREVAECLGLREETVKTRFFRAKESLREALAGEPDAAAPAAFPFHRPRCNRVAAAVLARIKQG